MCRMFIHGNYESLMGGWRSGVEVSFLLLGVQQPETDRISVGSIVRERLGASISHSSYIETIGRGIGIGPLLKLVVSGEVSLSP